MMFKYSNTVQQNNGYNKRVGLIKRIIDSLKNC